MNTILHNIQSCLKSFGSFRSNVFFFSLCVCVRVCAVCGVCVVGRGVTFFITLILLLFEIFEVKCCFKFPSSRSPFNIFRHSWKLFISSVRLSVRHVLSFVNILGLLPKWVYLIKIYYIITIFENDMYNIYILLAGTFKIIRIDCGQRAIYLFEVHFNDFTLLHAVWNLYALQDVFYSKRCV